MAEGVGNGEGGGKRKNGEVGVYDKGTEERCREDAEKRERARPPLLPWRTKKEETTDSEICQSSPL